MITAPQFADAVGRRNIAEALNVGLTAVSNAVVRGRFPASWFVTCSALAVIAGVECPPGLFGMRKPDNTPNVEGGKRFQVTVAGMETLTRRKSVDRSEGHR